MVFSQKSKLIFVKGIEVAENTENAAELNTYVKGPSRSTCSCEDALIRVASPTSRKVRSFILISFSRREI